VKRIIYFAFLVIPGLNPYQLIAQLTVTQGAAMGMTPLQLVQTQLVGQGISVSNATYNGSPLLISSNQIGYFGATGGALTELGLNAGLILTCGCAVNAIGPNNTCDFTCNTNGSGDPDLSIIANNATTYDKCVLEFDFIPEADTLKFMYVFGSEEFYEFCNSNYNDAFGFFLSGPGIAGTFSNNSVDIALMPGSSNYVTINNICNDASSIWCNKPLDCPHSNPPPPAYSNCTNPRGHGVYLQYNGFTWIYTAWHLVIPCSTYHIKLAVADVADHNLDSGVFLEKNSFSATGLEVTNTFTMPTLGMEAIEGCSDAIVSFILQSPATTPYVVHYSIGGTALNGVDYTMIPDSVIIPPGHDSTSIVIHPYMDNIPEGTETVILGVIVPSCNGTSIFYDTVLIYDNTTLIASAGNDTSVCSGSTVTLHATPGGGQISYHYKWSTGSTLQNITFIPPPGVHSYTLTVTDACIATALDNVIVTTLQVPLVTTSPLGYTNCSGAATNIILVSNIPGSTFTWTAASNSPDISGYSSGSGTLISQILFNNGTVRDTVTYSVIAANNGCTGPTVKIKVIVVPVLTLTFQPPGQSICSGQTTNISILPSSAGATISWTFTMGSPNITGASNGTGTIIMQTIINNGIAVDSVVYHLVASESGCNGSTFNVTVLVAPKPSIINTKSIDTLCNNTATNIVLVSNIPGSTFTWTASGNDTTVTGYSDGNGPAIIQTLFNSGTAVDTVIFHVTPVFGLCNGNLVNFKELVYPVAEVIFNPDSQILCSGEITGIGLFSQVTGTTFSWTATASSTYVSGYGPGSGNSIHQTLATSSYTLDSVIYTVIPSFRKCTGTANDIKVVIKPLPAVTLIPCIDNKTTSNSKPFQLKGGLPLGGTYSGPGVNPGTGIFTPSFAGTGIKTIHYAYTNFYGCSGSATKTISVASPPGFICNNLFTDIRDNKQYPTVLIGTQCWFAVNLNFGSAMSASSMQTDNCQVEKYCWQDIAANCTLYGGLYQWDEVMQYNDAPGIQGFCPPAWHIPTENDWNLLFSAFTNNGYAGNPLKYTGFSGFNAFLNGTRFENTNFYFSTFATLFWSSVNNGSEKAWAHGMNSYNPSVSYYPSLRSNAFSVRCIKD
jgi:uncharacterized protein (TIGR02145 family)